jgi:hypothetical protein
LVLSLGVRCEFQDRTEEPVGRVADLELGGVHAYGQAAHAGVEIVAGQGALMTLGKAAAPIQGGMTCPARR